MRETVAQLTERQGQRGAGLMVFALLAALGLYCVKWGPSYDKALLVAAGGQMGSSVLTGGRHVLAAPWQAAWEYAWAYGRDIWKALVLGLFLGAGVQAFVPAEWTRRLFGRAGYGSVAKAGLVSVPSMMCTCCAAPVAVGLRKAGASVAAALAYWLGNPLLNPATLVLTGFVLGWGWVALRLGAGLVLVFGASSLVVRLVDSNQPSAGSEVAIPAAFVEQGSPEPSVWLRWCKEFWRLSISLIPEYVVLVFLLGAARAWLFPAGGHGAIGGFLWTAAMACVGALFVIPTAAEIPIVQGMMALGLGAGPAAALLITLPALSMPSLAMMTKGFPPRVLGLLTLAVVATGLLAGAIAQPLGSWYLAVHR